MSAFIACCLSTLLLWGASGYVIEEYANSTEHHFDTPINSTEVPFMAYVEMAACNAVIVDKQFLLATAHCVVFPFCYGLFDTVKVGTGETVGVEQVFAPPKYVVSALNDQTDYNIAVIKLNQSLEWGERVQPIRMADEYLVLRDGDRLRAISTSHGGQKLFETDMTYMEQDRCEELVFENRSYDVIDINERTLCANQDTGEAGRFQAGPIIYNNTLIGLPMTEYRRTNNTRVFSRVSELRSFIDDTIKTNS